MPKVAGTVAPKHWTTPGCSGGSTINWPVSHRRPSAPGARGLGPPKDGWFGDVAPEAPGPRGRPPRRRDHMYQHGYRYIYIYLSLSKVDGGEVIRQAPPLL
jgi:hypothetical protein